MSVVGFNFVCYRFAHECSRVTFLRMWRDVWAGRQSLPPLLLPVCPIQDKPVTTHHWERSIQSLIQLDKEGQWRLGGGGLQTLGDKTAYCGIAVVSMITPCQCSLAATYFTRIFWMVPWRVKLLPFDWSCSEKQLLIKGLAAPIMFSAASCALNKYFWNYATK